MNYYSLKNASPEVDFREATLRGQAPDGGLYFPRSIPHYPEKFFVDARKIPDVELASLIIKPFIGGAIPCDDVEEIVAETLNFPLPLVPLSDQIFSLELFHGNTLAFKDVGARFMSRCLRYFVKSIDRRIVVLVATSGDTGGAVADGFYDIPGIEVVILFPSGKVSRVQELQLTGHGKNIHALEVAGNFDDCQRLVKTAFRDGELNNRAFLTSANSINVARWLPQQFFYYLAYKHWPYEGSVPVISVPSGNFGNVCAGLLAQSSGLPIDHFIAACNANDTVPEFMRSGVYTAKKAVHTISNAMDVGDPSNIQRVLALFNNELNSLAKVLSSVSIDDHHTRQRIAEVFNKSGYILDPHGAVGYVALDDYLESHDTRGIFMETAHPIKFSEEIEPLIGSKIPVPPILESLPAEHHSQRMGTDYQELKEFLKGFG